MSSYQERNEKKSDTVYWVIAVALLVTGVAAPVGILMIVLKLLTRNKKRGRHPYYVQQEENGPGARATAAGEAEPEEAAKPAKKKRGGKKAAGAGQDLVRDMAASSKGMVTGGAALSAAFGCMAVINAADNLWMLPDILWYLEEIIPLLCFTTVGLGVLWAGLRRRKQAHRYRGYLAMIGQRKSISISSLSAATGSPAAKVREDLEDMLDDGFFPSGFLDYGGDRLVVSGTGLEEEPAPEKKAAPQQEEPAAEDAVLSEIRAVSGAVDNPRLSAQIDRIGIITAKILEYQRNRPEKAPQLHSFLSYYLPTTLKILRAYSQLEDQEVSGENITSAMERIEGMMDKVVEGFEKQLDLLFQGDAMDITTDVEVLERMLAKDGLSDHDGMTLNL